MVDSRCPSQIRAAPPVPRGHRSREESALLRETGHSHMTALLGVSKTSVSERLCQFLAARLAPR